MQGVRPEGVYPVTVSDTADTVWAQVLHRDVGCTDGSGERVNKLSYHPPFQIGTVTNTY